MGKAWNNEDKFQRACHEAAKSVFNDVQRALYRKIFLVCVPGDKGTGSDIHTIDAKDRDDPSKSAVMPNVTDKYFAHVKDALDVLRATRDAAKRADAAQQASSNERWKLWNERSAVEVCIKNRENNQFHNVFFVSNPVLVNKYDVFAVLVLNANMYKKFNRVDTRWHGKHGDLNSFVDCIAEQLLDEVQKALKVNADPDGSTLYRLYSQEIKTKVAKSFVCAIAMMCRYAAPKGCTDDALVEKANACKRGARSFYDVVSEMSRLSHEREGAHGMMILAQDGHPSVSYLARFKDKVAITIENVQYIRKLLNLTNDSVGLICDAGYIYGVGNVTDEQDKSDWEIFKFVFESRGDWRLVNKGYTLMSVRCSMVARFDNAISWSMFRKCAQYIFGVSMSNASLQRMYDCVKGVVARKHGGVLVFSKKAKDEADRLSKVATVIDPPVSVNAYSVASLSSIDGAVLMDTDCKCYATGVILDGIANGGCGNKSRGSRYNSSERYAENNKVDTTNKSAPPATDGQNDKDKFVGATGMGYDLMVVVVSEDGLINIFPANRPIENAQGQQPSDTYDIESFLDKYFDKLLNGIANEHHEDDEDEEYVDDVDDDAEYDNAGEE